MFIRKEFMHVNRMLYWFLNEINTFISEDALNWSKVAAKTFIILQKISIPNKSFLRVSQKILLKFSIDIAGINYIWKYIKTEISYFTF